jgi:hypothetical protein
MRWWNLSHDLNLEYFSVPVEDNAGMLRVDAVRAALAIAATRFASLLLAALTSLQPHWALSLRTKSTTIISTIHSRWAVDDVGYCLIKPSRHSHRQQTRYEF